MYKRQPYAASIDDVINNNFDPKVDPLFNEIAKENKNVALVGTQGEILQNKALLVDALHTNAEGTSIYNQSVIDALSQFKNEVPSSAPQDIAQVQKTNTVATTPSVITQAAANQTSIQDTLKNQILGQGKTSLWSGEGFGSAEANAADMAKILAGIGITDISQFGQIEKVIPAQEQQFETGDGFTTVLVPEHTVTTFGNKVTGQEVPNTYGERQGGNFFGGTYAGSGNTGYGVQFDAAGNPVFYTQGASSKDASLVPLVQMALMATGAGGALGNALLGAGASPIAAGALGNAIIGGTGSYLTGGDALKGALLGGAGGALSGYLQSGPIDASNMTSTQFNDALETQLIKEMQGIGLSNDQISQWLENASAADIASVTSKIPVTNASDNLVVEAAKTPITANALIDTLAQIPTVVATGTRTPENLSPDTLNAVTSILSGGTAATPNVEVTGIKEKPSSITDLITAPIVIPANLDVPTIPTTTTDLSTSDKLKIAQIGLGAAGLLGAGAAVAGGGGGGSTQYPIVDVPSTWTTPPKTTVAGGGVGGGTTQLTPINFGDRNLLIGTQWEKFLDPNYGKIPQPTQYAQPSNMSYGNLMDILSNKQGTTPASSLSINDIISGIQNQYVPKTTENVATTSANAGLSRFGTSPLPQSVMQSIIGTGATTGLPTAPAKTATTTANTVQNLIQTLQGGPVQTNAATNAGMFQKVYDPVTGREFNSPAQAAQYGVTNYVTSLPSNIPLPATTQNAVNAWLAQSGNEGKTVDQALDAIASTYGLTGAQLRNYEIQGTLRSAESQQAQNAVSTASGGLSPEQLISKLQAYKANPPKTAQEFADQNALYADYANRYANSSYNYANMGGVPQDLSLKPAPFLPTTYTGYAAPISQYLSSTNQMTPTFTQMQDILTQKPEINLAFQNVLAANPNAFTGGNSITEATINNLASDINKFGTSTALKNFYIQQQNLLGDTSSRDMTNPQYAALQKQIMAQTEKVSDPLWNTMAKAGIGENKISSFWRDPTTGLGIGINESGNSLMYFDRDGRPLSSSVTSDLAQNAAKYGINTTGFTGLAQPA